MDWIHTVIDYVLHLDRHLQDVISQYGAWSYAIMFGIVFAETGFVVTPFLPGDSLLFAAGIFSGEDHLLNVWLVGLTFVTAALLGDNVNYHIGKYLGPRVFKNENSKLFKRSHLDTTHAFFEKYGPKAIIIARFVPIVRTFSPFVAGIGRMTYPKFLLFSFIGALIWVTVCTGGGYLFGRLLGPDNFHYAILLILGVTVIPPLFEIVRRRYLAKRRKREAAAVVE